MATRRRQCENKPDAFCYICGCFTLIRQRRNITSFVRRAYKAYFGLALGDQDKKWAPRIVCHNCEEMLRDWTKGKCKGLPFEIPMTCREPTDHTTDCYSCLVNTKGIGKKLWLLKKRKTDTKSHILVSPQQSDLLCTLMSCQSQFLKDFFHLKMWVVTKSKRLLMKLKKYFHNLAILFMRPQSLTPQQFSQPELNDLARDLGLQKCSWSFNF